MQTRDLFEYIFFGTEPKKLVRTTDPDSSHAAANTVDTSQLESMVYVMTKDETLKLALEALKQIDEAMPFPVAKLAQAAIKEALAQSEQCQCPNCKVTLHASDCAVHSGPAYPAGKCDCGAQRKPLTDEMVVAAARVLSDRQAAACNVDCGDMWKLHGNDFIDDARAALEAAHNIGEKK